MNRQNEENHARKNHYADFDEHGNMRNDNRNRDLRSEDRNRESHRFGGHDQRQGDERNSLGHESRDMGDYNYPKFGARAYGDMSGGTPYGEGGSTYGGASSYGRSNYGFSGEYGPSNDRGNRKRSENIRNGYGDFAGYNSRNYGSYAGSNYRGHMDRENNRGDRGYSGSGYGNTGRENTGYERGFSNYGRTGYGSTGYNNRDLDRERSTTGTRGYGNLDRSLRSEHSREHDFYDRYNQNSSNRGSQDRDMDWQGY